MKAFNYATLLFFASAFLIFSSCQKDKETIEIACEPEPITCLAEIDGIFQEVILDEPPLYLDGGDEGFLTNLLSSIVYPAEARANNIEGSPIVEYEITEEGTVENITILNDPGGGIGEELRTKFEDATSGTSFSPGIFDNNPVRVKKQLTVTFKLQG